MNKLFEDLKSYLDDNFISYKTIKNDSVLEINGQTYELFEPFKWENEDKGTFFDQSFHWACDKTDYDNYIFSFGSVWYYLKKGNEKSVKLERVKWIGKSNIDDELKIDSYLGVHGVFELLNGVNNYNDWCKKAKFLGITALGICEKNTVAAAMKFQTACQSAEIRPIQGMEIVIGNEEKDLRYTIKVFVQNKKGWQNLLEINKILNVDKQKFLKEEDIPKYREGLFIVLDPKTTDYDSLPLSLKRDESLYYQLDTVVYEKEDRDEAYLKNLKKFFDSNLLPLAMCDAYYTEKEYAPIRQKLNKLAGVVNYESENQYFKNYLEYFDELEKLFPEDDFDLFYEFWKLAIDNLNYISLNCNFEIETQVRHMPTYYMTDEEALVYENNKQMFEDLIYKGIEEHPELLQYEEAFVVDRLDQEIQVIEEGGVEDYFLTLRDIINFCKENNILLGSGRGCFLPDQEVLLKNGDKKKIQEVKRGDSVLTFWNEKNDVVNLFEYDCNEEIVELEFDAHKIIRCTKDHKFYTTNRGWVEADRLEESDDIVYIGPLIYKATNMITGEIYIGKTTRGLEKRIIFHEKDFKSKEKRTPFYLSIEKYGWEAFTWEVVEYIDKEEDLNEKEIFYIDHYKKEKGDLIYNIAPGGDGGNMYDLLNSQSLEQVKKKISQKVTKSKRWTPKARSKQSAIMKGNKLMNPKVCEQFSKRQALYYIVQISKDCKNIIEIYDSPLDLRRRSGFIINAVNKVTGNLTRSYKGYKWQKFKKDEVKKEDIYKLFRESI